MSDNDYGIAEASRDRALEGARSVAHRLRKVAAEIEKLADEAEAAPERRIPELGARVAEEVLAGVSALHLAQVVRGSVGWAGAHDDAANDDAQA